MKHIYVMVFTDNEGNVKVSRPDGRFDLGRKRQDLRIYLVPSEDAAVAKYKKEMGIE